MPTRNYTDEQRAEALEIYAEHGERAAANAVGCSPGTVSKWAKAAGVASVRTEKTRAATEQVKAEGELSRATVRQRFLEVAQAALERAQKPYETHVGVHARRVVYDHPPAQDVRNLVLAAAVALDKVRLEDGEATDRREHVSQSEFDREVNELVAKVRGSSNGAHAG